MHTKLKFLIILTCILDEVLLFDTINERLAQMFMLNNVSEPANWLVCSSINWHFFL